MVGTAKGGFLFTGFGCDHMSDLPTCTSRTLFLFRKSQSSTSPFRSIRSSSSLFSPSPSSPNLLLEVVQNSYPSRSFRLYSVPWSPFLLSPLSLSPNKPPTSCLVGSTTPPWVGCLKDLGGYVPVSYFFVFTVLFLKPGVGGPLLPLSPKPRPSNPTQPPRTDLWSSS